MSPQENTLETWLEKHQDEIVQMVEFSKAPLPDDAGGLHNELSRTQQEIARAGAFLADVEAFLSGAEASATLSVRKEYPELAADERTRIVRDRVKDVKRLADSLRVVVSALRNKSFAMMNLGRSR